MSSYDAVLVNGQACVFDRMLGEDDLDTLIAWGAGRSGITGRPADDRYTMQIETHQEDGEPDAVLEVAYVGGVPVACRGPRAYDCRDQMHTFVLAWEDVEPTELGDLDALEGPPDLVMDDLPDLPDLDAPTQTEALRIELDGDLLEVVRGRMERGMDVWGFLDAHAPYWCDVIPDGEYAPLMQDRRTYRRGCVSHFLSHFWDTE